MGRKLCFIKMGEIFQFDFSKVIKCNTYPIRYTFLIVSELTEKHFFFSPSDLDKSYFYSYIIKCKLTFFSFKHTKVFSFLKISLKAKIFNIFNSIGKISN